MKKRVLVKHRVVLYIRPIEGTKRKTEKQLKRWLEILLQDCSNYKANFHVADVMNEEIKP